MNEQILDALNYLDEEIRNDPNKISSFHLKAELYFSVNQIDKCKEVVEQLAVRMNNRILAYYSTSRHFQFRKLFSESIFVVEMLLKELPYEQLLLNQKKEVEKFLESGQFYARSKRS